MIYPTLPTHAPISGHLASFHLLAITNNAAVNMGVQITRRVPIFNSFKYIPRSGMFGSNHSVFKFLRNCPTVLNSVFAILHLHQQGKRVLVSPYPSQR